MFIKNDIVYAGEPTNDLKVTSARAVGNSCLLVTFSTGETRLFDATELLDLPVFKPLNDEATLATFTIDHGILTWLDGEIDISPKALYARSYAYQEAA